MTRVPTRAPYVGSELDVLLIRVARHEEARSPFELRLARIVPPRVRSISFGKPPLHVTGRPGAAASRRVASCFHHRLRAPPAEFESQPGRERAQQTRGGNSGYWCRRIHNWPTHSLVNSRATNFDPPVHRARPPGRAAAPSRPVRSAVRRSCQERGTRRRVPVQRGSYLRARWRKRTLAPEPAVLGRSPSRLRREPRPAPTRPFRTAMSTEPGPRAPRRSRPAARSASPPPQGETRTGSGGRASETATGPRSEPRVVPMPLTTLRRRSGGRNPWLRR